MTIVQAILLAINLSRTPSSSDAIRPDLDFRSPFGGARRVNARLLPSFAFETGDEAPNPIPTKAMLRVLGLPVGQCRLPMGDAPDWAERRAREVLAALEEARG